MPLNVYITTNTSAKGIVAHAGGGQLLATPLTNSKNRIDTVASNGDSLLMPDAIAGVPCEVFNNGLNDANLFPKSGEKFIDENVNVPKILVPGQKISCFCFEGETGTWTY